MSWTEENATKYVRLYQFYGIFASLDFTRGLFLIYLLGVGLDHKQVGFLQGLLFWSSLLFELPSGLIADRFKRKYSVIAGGLMLASAYFLFSVGTNFYHFVVVFALLGAGYAFKSGANSALLYDGLQQAGPSWLSKHMAIVGTNRSLTTLATAFAMGVSGFIYALDQKLIFIASLLAMILALLCISKIVESRVEVIERKQADSLREAFQKFFSQPKGRRLISFIIGMALIEAMHTPFFIFSQVLFKNVGVDSVYIPLILTAGFLGSAMGQHLAPKLSVFPLPNLIVAFAFVLIASLGGLLMVQDPVWLILIFLVVNTLPNILFVHTDQYIQESCSSSIRASLISIQAFTMSIFTGMSFVGIGYLGEFLEMAQALALTSVFVVIGTAIVLYHFRQRVDS